METVLRVAVIYLFIMAVLRLLGKRELSQLSPLELVMLILIPELVAQALVREDFSMTNAIIAVCTLCTLVFITSAMIHRFRWAGRLIEGEPSLAIRKGEPVLETLDRERLPLEEIYAEMRKAGIERIEDVKWGILETDGRIAIIGYGPQEPRGQKDEEMVK